MSGPLVSVCMPCHNAAPYVRAAVDSVLAQTYPRVEVVAVDDGSTDGTGAILDDYAARHGVVVLRASLGSASKARNLAFRRSRGEFVKFFDADDLISPEMISLQVGRLRAEPDCVASSRWARFRRDPLDAAWSPETVWRDMDPVDWLVESLRDGPNMMQPGMFLASRTLLDRAGLWDERLTRADDFEFFVRVLLASSGVRFTDGTLYYRSGLAGSLSGRTGREAIESATLALDLGLAALLRADDSPRVRRVAANLTRHWIHQMGPRPAALVRRLRRRVEELGGADRPPPGGPRFTLLARVVGWTVAWRLRSCAERCRRAVRGDRSRRRGPG